MKAIVAPSILAAGVLCFCSANAVDVLTSRNNRDRTGINDQERVRIPREVFSELKLNNIAVVPPQA